MKRIPKSQGRARALRRPFLPHVETLEQRLPPGDTILGGLVARSLIAPGLSFGDGLLSLGEGSHIAVAEGRPIERTESRDESPQVVLGRRIAGSPDATALGDTREVSPDRDRAAPGVRTWTAGFTACEDPFAASWEFDSFDISAPLSEAVATNLRQRLADLEGDRESFHAAGGEAGRVDASRETDTSAEQPRVERSETGYESAASGREAYAPPSAGLASLAAAAAAQPAPETGPGGATRSTLDSDIQLPLASVSPSPQPAVPPTGSVWTNKRSDGSTGPRDASGLDYVETLTVLSRPATR
jgi:hypothetical protein